MATQGEVLPYIGECVCIRHQGPGTYAAFMTKYSNHNDASDDWFNLDDNFGPQGQWKRSYWDFVGVKNVRDDSVRGGVYVNARNTTVYITVYSVDNIRVTSVRRP